MSINTSQFQVASQKVLDTSEALKKLSADLKDGLQSINGSVIFDPTPRMFCGTIQGYRYTTGRKGALPSHRFEVACGDGIVLHVEVYSQRFDQLMSEMEVGEITPTVMNNRTIVIERTSGSLFARKIIQEEIGASDKWGNYLFKGVSVFVTTLNVMGVVRYFDDDGYIGVEFEDGTMSEYVGSNLVVDYTI